MPNPINPLEWLRLAQDWFRKTERSSGFRPYLIFLLLLFGFAIVIQTFFPQTPLAQNIVPLLIEIAVGAFVLVFAVKAFQDPNFCRSEKHIENVKRIAVMEQKGDAGPQIIDADKIQTVPNPRQQRLPGGGE